MKRNELNDLVAFAAVAQERSFTRAAARLSMSPSALSHAMRGLEDRLGVRLLARTTRSVAPTEAGVSLLKSLTPALAEIEGGLQAVLDWRNEPSGTIRLTSQSYAAKTILAEKLPSFLLAHPGISVEVDVDDVMTDIVANGFDAGIRFGDAVARDMIAVRIGSDVPTVVVGTPEYLARRPAPIVPSDLADHDCIGYRIAGFGNLMPWRFERDGREVKIQVDGPLVVNTIALVGSAVRAGVGLAYMKRPEIEDEIRAGKLVPVLTDWCPPFVGCHLYHSSRRHSPPALRALVAALRVPA